MKNIVGHSFSDVAPPFVTVTMIKEVLLKPPQVCGAHRTWELSSELVKCAASERSLNAPSAVAAGPHVRNVLVSVSFQPVI